MAKRRIKQTQCQNCNFTFKVANNFCPNCGQENHNIIQPIKHVVKETFESTLSLDTRIWNSLKALLLKPGQLTLDYIGGKRLRHVPPIRLYVFVSLVYFFLLSIKPGETLQISGGEVNVDSLLQDTSAVLNFNGKKLQLHGHTIGDIADMNDHQLDSLLELIDTEPSWLMHKMLRQVGKFGAGGADEYKRTLLKGISFGMFLLMPLFGGLLALVYYRRKKLYLEHLFFSVHLHTFFFFFWSIQMVVNWMVDSFFVSLLAALIALFYFWKAHRKVYPASRWRNFGSMSLAGIPYLALIVFFTGLLAVIAIFSF